MGTKPRYGGQSATRRLVDIGGDQARDRQRNAPREILEKPRLTPRPLKPLRVFPRQRHLEDHVLAIEIETVDGGPGEATGQEPDGRGLANWSAAEPA
jgi:hypothetical protein